MHARSGDEIVVDGQRTGTPQRRGQILDVRMVAGVDIAYLNAGIAIGQADIAALSDDDYRRIMRVNVDGVVFGARAAIRVMTRRGGGSIVATSSLAGIVPFPIDPVYDLTKHAV